MMRFAGVAAFIAVAIGAATAANATFDVRYETEKSGMQSTTATFNTGGVETFDSRSSGSGFTADFGTKGAITGVYQSSNGGSVQINDVDQYGGAGGTGKYIVAFAKTPYELDLSSKIDGGVNYFGYWLSALDAGNTVSFYSGGNLLFTFDSQDALNAVKSSANSSDYFGNPNYSPRPNTGEPYVFLNFFSDSGSFDRVVFAEKPTFGGGYESDNHTVGHFLTKGTGTSVKLSNSTAAVPETSTWAMMLVGFGTIGAAMRSRPASKARTQRA